MAAAVSALLLGLSACSGDPQFPDPWGGEMMNDNATDNDPSGKEDDKTGGSTAGVITKGDVTTFSVAWDETALDEAYAVDSEDEDYIENNSFDYTVTIRYGSGGATVEGDKKGYVTVSGNDVTVNNTGSDKILYDLGGTAADGFFKLYSGKKQAIRLNGLHLTNPDGAAINNQSKKRTYIVLADGTENTLVDGTKYTDAVKGEDMKAAFFSEGQLIFSGKGYLSVDGNCKAGIRSDDYVRFFPGVRVSVDASSGNGIHGNDAVLIDGGVINVKVTGDADKAISTDGYVQIDGGRTTLLTSGGHVWDEEDNDFSACSGIKADSLFRITGGALYCQSFGIGGKGISCDGKAFFEGGNVRIITTGKSYSEGSYSVSAKGVKADGDLTVSGGTIQVRTTGGEGSEGIESKGILSIKGGTVEVYAYDDALNSKLAMKVTGGYVYAHSTNNDALDANTNLYLNGGVVVAVGGNQPENPFDAAEGYNIYINGGTLVGYGASLAHTASTSTQYSVETSVNRGTQVALYDGSTPLLSFKTPSTSGGTALMFSCSALASGASYTLKSGVSVTGGTDFYGLNTEGTVSGGSKAGTLKAAASVGQMMGGGGMPGGFPGGGR